MTYLNYFQFDDEPFSNTGKPKYKFRIKKQWKVFNKILDICYEKNKISFVYGKEGVGKTFLVHELENILEKSKNVVIYNSKSARNLEDFLKNSLRNSKNSNKKVVFIIDDYEELLKTEKDFIEKKITNKFLKENKLNIIIFSSEPAGYIWEINKLTKYRFKISSMSLFETYLYANYMIKKTKALNSWRKGFPKWFILFITGISNGRVKFVNILAGEAIQNAYKKKRHAASVRGLMGYFSEDTRILRTNLSERFKQLFIIITSFFLLVEMSAIIKDKRHRQAIFNITQEIENEFLNEEREKEELAKERKAEEEIQIEKKAVVKKSVARKAPVKKVERKKITDDNGDIYILVSRGDSFSKIAKELNISEKELEKMNTQIPFLGNLNIGDKIYIERKDSSKDND